VIYRLLLGATIGSQIVFAAYFLRYWTQGDWQRTCVFCLSLMLANNVMISLTLWRRR